MWICLCVVYVCTKFVMCQLYSLKYCGVVSKAISNEWRMKAMIG